MSIRYGDVDWTGAKPFPFYGFDIQVLPDGRVYANEWVYDEHEDDGVVQVHDDEGRDYIVSGDPTVGMLYGSPEVFAEFAREVLLDRLADTIRSAAQAIAGVERR